LRRSDTLGILAVLTLLSVPLCLIGQQSTGDCSPLLSDAKKEFARSNHEIALAKLHALLDQASLMEKCPESDKEEAYFLHSFCHFLLNACNHPETEEAIQLLKMNVPAFETDFASKMAQPEYSWVAQAWKECCQRVKVPIDRKIEDRFRSGKKLMGDNDHIAAIQKFVGVIQLIESYDTAHKFADQLDLSKYYIDTCQKKLISTWTDLASHNDFESLKKLEDEILSLEKREVYLKDLIALFDKLNTQNAQNAWNDHQNQLASLINGTKLAEVDFAALQDQLKIVKSVKAAGLGLASVNIDSSMIASFQAYAEHISQQYYVNQEGGVKNVFDTYKQYIVTNCPDSAAAVQKIYTDTLNSPSAVYDKNFSGVTPPVSLKHIFTPPDCVQKFGLSGNVRLFFKIDPTGKVVSVEIATDGYQLNRNRQDPCAKAYVDAIQKDLKERKFTPAFKAKDRPAAAPFAGSPAGLAPKDKIPVTYSNSIVYRLQ